MAVGDEQEAVRGARADRRKRIFADKQSYRPPAAREAGVRRLSGAAESS